jgi:hypothetical protein
MRLAISLATSLATSLLCIALLTLGCGDDSSSSVPQDLSATPGGDLAGVAPRDLAGTTTTDAGSVGGTCTSACDCMPGLGCFMGKCTTTTQPIYCCGSATCPSGSVCQSPNGVYGVCGNPGGADLAMFDYCTLIHCTAGTMMDCTRAGCTSCNTAGMHCAK